MIDLKSPESLSLIIPLYTIDDDLRYEGDCWEDQANRQDGQGQDEMLQSEWLKRLNLFFFLEWIFSHQ